MDASASGRKLEEVAYCWMSLHIWILRLVGMGWVQSEIMWWIVSGVVLQKGHAMRCEWLVVFCSCLFWMFLPVRAHFQMILARYTFLALVVKVFSDMGSVGQWVVVREIGVGV